MDNRPLGRRKATDRLMGEKCANARRKPAVSGRRRARTVAALALAALALAAAPLGTSAASSGATASNVLVQKGGKLTGAGASTQARVGSSAALSSDGATLVVGAPEDGTRGSVYVFTRSGEEWTQQGEALTPGELPGEAEECTADGCASECAEEAAAEGETSAECAFGVSVAVSADGNTVLVGAPSSTAAPGAVWVFTRSGATWTRSAVLVSGDTRTKFHGRFGRSVALSADGAIALVGDPSANNGVGAASLFTREGAKWTPLLSLSDDEASSFGHFGRSVALSADATTALVGGPGDNGFTGAAWVFAQSGGAWQQEPGKLVGEGAGASARFGKSVALSGDGTTALVGAENADGGRGAVWTFARGESGFAQQGGALAPTPMEEAQEAISGTGGHFGTSVALSGDGGKALIGAPRAFRGDGTVTQLKREGATWDRLEEGLAGEGSVNKGWRGASVALSNDGFVAAIGSPRDHGGQGAAWVFAEEPPAAIPPPSVTKVVPGHGPTAGGTEVTISGGNFNEATEVRFGATPAASFHVENAAEVVAVTPPGAAGKAHVTVTTPKGTSETSTKDLFVYEEPETGGGPGGGGGEPTHEPTTSTNGSTKTGAGASGGVASGGVQAFAASSACRVSLAKKRLAVTRYRTVALRLNRTGVAACGGSVALSYKVKGKGRSFTLRTIGTASFSLSASTTTRVVTVTLSKAGQRWLRAHRGKGNASLAIALITPPPTLAQSSSVRLSLKMTRKTSAPVAGTPKH